MSTVESPTPCKAVRSRVSLTASYTSTVAEEMVVLLRKLHSLDVWNPHVNAYISIQLPAIIAALDSSLLVGATQALFLFHVNSSF